MTSADAAPAISIVMPCFNGAAYLRASLASALGQSFTDTELIVVDDGSTDGSADILRSVTDPRLRVLRQANQGVCAARNAALALARGRYVAFLDSDDTWEPDALQVLHDALQAPDAADAALAYAGWRNVGLPGPRGEPYVPPDVEGPGKLERLFDNCQWPIHACLVRRDAVKAAGGFDPRFRTSEDWLLWLKIGMQRRLVRVPRVVAHYHFHEHGQATSDRSAAALNLFHAQRAFVREHPGVARLLGTAGRHTMVDGLLQRGMACQWAGELKHARPIFAALLRHAPWDLQWWPHARYVLPSVLPLRWHVALARLFGRSAGSPSSPSPGT